MAAPDKAEEVARHLAELRRLNLSNIAPKEDLIELIENYFVALPSQEESDFSEWDEEEEEDTFTPSSSRPGSSSRSIDLPSHSSGSVCAGVADVTEPGDDEDDEDEETITNNGLENLAATIMPGVETDVPLAEVKDSAPCSCKLNAGKPCFTQFDEERVQQTRLQYLGMSREEFDIAILAKLECGMSTGAQTKSKHKKPSERQRDRTEFFYLGASICRIFFLYLYSLGKDKFDNLRAHFKAVGVEARQHKNLKKRPRHSLSYADTRGVVDFILNYAEINAITLPGRQRGIWKTDVKLLPTNITRRAVYEFYCQSLQGTERRVVKLRTFYNLWQELTPFVTTMRPATDLCWYCQENSAKLVRTANMPDHVKSEAVKAIEEHLACAQKERSFYNFNCDASKECFPPGGSLGRHDPCSFDGFAHYSFDFAQQVHYPSNPLQPGPIFFKTPRKCGLFGVACEAISSQVNFLLEEAVSCGKGADCVVSLLHYFFENYGIGETHVHLNADNCSGQNKNNCMMQYLMWRVLTGRHQSIKLSFLLTGHTKFSCDWCFGLVKRKYRLAKVDCLDDIVNVVNTSSTGNIAQKCGTEDGTVVVPIYGWTAFLKPMFQKIKNIKRYHHFGFQQGSQHVVLKFFSDSPEEEYLLINKDFDVTAMPEQLQPKGLDAARQWYLHNEIRRFVSDEHQDVVAPLPTCPKPGVRGEGDSSDEETEEPSVIKKGRGESSQGRGTRGKGSAGGGKGKGKATRGRGKGKGAASS